MFQLTNLTLKDTVTNTVVPAGSWGMVIADAGKTYGGETAGFRDRTNNSNPIRNFFGSAATAYMPAPSATNPGTVCTVPNPSAPTETWGFWSLQCKGTGTNANVPGLIGYAVSPAAVEGFAGLDAGGDQGAAFAFGVVLPIAEVTKTVASRTAASDTFTVTSGNGDTGTFGTASTGAGASAATGFVPMRSATFTLGETISANADTYITSWNCSDRSGLGAYSPVNPGNVKTATFPSTELRRALSCTLTNTALTAPVISAPSGITVGPLPAITGTGTAGAAIAVADLPAGTSCTTTVAADGTWSCTPSTALPSNSYTVTATQTLSPTVSPASASVSFTVDADPPAAPVITSPVDGSTIPGPISTISGTGEAGATITNLTNNGTAVSCLTAAITVASNGTWTCTLLAAISQPGTYTLSATQTDSVGNVSVAGTTTFTIPKPPPAAPVITSPLDGSTVASVQAISGTGEPGATIAVYVDGSVVTCFNAPVTVGAGGAWSCTLTADVTATGTHTIGAEQTDAQNQTSPRATIGVNIDSSAPATPVITSPVPASTIPGPVAQVTGTGEPGATVTVSAPGARTCTTTVTVAADGTWTCQLTSSITADGTYAVTATQTDAVGQVSPAATSTFAIDTTPPAAPVITTPTDGMHYDSAIPAITGTGEPGATIALKLGGAAISCTTPVVADSSGSWTCTLTTPITADATYLVTAVQTDAADRASPAAEVSFTIDTLAPSAPGITDPIDGSTRTTAVATITGTAEPGVTIQLTVDGSAACTGPVTAGGTGQWTCPLVTPITADGTSTIRAVAFDGVNTSPAATSVFTIDTIAPTAPVIEHPANGSVSTTAVTTISGAAEAGATITVTGLPAGKTCTGPVVADSSGLWTCTLTSALTDGTYTVHASATDAAGLTSGQATSTFIVDTTAPAVPVVTEPVDGSVTNVAVAAIRGTGTAGAVITVAGLPATTSCASQVVVGSTGSWTCTLSSALTDGTYTVTATAADTAGNVSAASAPTSFTVDTTAPAAPVIIAPVTGSLTKGPVTAVTGTAEPGATVTVTLPAGHACSGPVTAAAGTGAWTCTLDVPLTADGTFTVLADATDPAGNTGPSANSSFTIDATPPAAPTIVTPADGALLPAEVATIGGTGEDGSLVTLTGLPTGTTCTNAPLTVVNGSWSCTLSTPLPGGTYSVTARAADGVGNVSGPATSAFSVDTTAPVVPVVTAPVNGLRNTAVTAVSGTGENGATVAVSVGGSLVSCSNAPVVVSGGSWTCQLATPLSSPGTYAVSAVQTDPAGNASPASAVVTVTIDTTAPVAPAITTPAPGVLTTPVTSVSGTGEAGTTITLAGLPAGTTCTPAPLVVAPDGTWTCTLSQALPDGAYTLTPTSTDAAGNATPGTPVSFTKDTTAPAAPVITAPAPGTFVNTPVTQVAGTGTPGATIALSVDGNPVACANAPVVVDPAGAWTCTLPAPITADGVHALSATAALGGTTSSPGTGSFTMDTRAPAPPNVTNPPDGAVLTTAVPVISGTGEPFATIGNFAVNGTPMACTTPLTVSAAGTWSCALTAAIRPAGEAAPTQPAQPAQPAQALAPGALNSAPTALAPFRLLPTGLRSPMALVGLGTYVITLTQVDRAGNVSTRERSRFTLVKPLAVTSTTATTAVPPVIGGVGAPGSTITITGLPVGVTCGPAPVKVTAAGSWSCTLNRVLAAGAYPLTVKETRTDGSTQTVPYTLTVKGSGSGNNGDGNNNGNGNNGNGNNGGTPHTPVTGSEALTTGVVGLSLVMLGLILVGATRRRRRTS